jgi:hypothetical protein
VSGCAAAALSCLSTAPMTAPRPSLAWTLFLHHQGQVPGRDCPRQLPQGLHGSGHHTLQSATPKPTFWQAPRLSRRHQVCLVFRPAGFLAFLLSGTAMRRSRNCFPVADRFFARPEPAAPSQSTQ